MRHRDMKWTNTAGQMVPVDLVDAGLPQTFDLFKKKNKKTELSVKHNKLRYAYIKIVVVK